MNMPEFATPIAIMPQAGQVLTYADLLRYFVVLLRSVFLEGTPVALLVNQLWPMAVIAAVTLSATTGLFRHRLY